MAVANSVGQYNENAGATYHGRDLRRFHDKLLGWDVRVPNAGLATSGIANGGVARYYGAATTGDCAVIQRGAGANMSVDVTAGAAMVGGTESATQGEYMVFNDATVNVVISAADPTNPRIDVVGIQIRDKEYSGATDDARILVVTGTPAASPAVPTLPADFLSLAHVAVAAAAGSILTANITDKRRNLTSLGGVIVADTDALLPTVNLWTGLVAFVRSSAAANTQPALYVYDATLAAWTALGQYARAWTVITDTLLGGDSTFGSISIPQTFAHVKILVSGRGNAAVASASLIMRINGDTAANYDYNIIAGVAGAATAVASDAQTSLSLVSFPGTTATAARSGAGEMTLHDYRAATFQKSIWWVGGFRDGGVGGGSGQQSGAWRSTAAITAVTLDFNAVGTGWKAGSRFTLVGLR